MKNTKFWIATEVNHTAAHTRKTLYMAGKQPLADILRNATQNSITHVSFEPGSLDISDTYFLETVDALTVAGYTITIEYDIRQHDAVVSYFGAKLFTSRNIIPIASLGNINILTINPNFSLAVNDKSADGRWCIGPSAIMDANRFTLFAEYDTSNTIQLDTVTPNSDEVTQRVAVADTAPVESVNTPELAPEYPGEQSPAAEIVTEDVASSVVPEPVVAEHTDETADTTLAEQTTNKRKRGGANAE